MFDTEDSLIRVDMSEFIEKFAVSRLMGAPPGYVGYDEGGQLTEAIRRRPYSVVLLDEIEKAHPDVFNILLQVLDDGRLTDNKGRTANFRNTIIIMTSNIGADIIRESYESLTIDNSEAVHARTKIKVFELLKRTIRPEFLNRIDETVMFEPLNREHTVAIAKIQFDILKKRIKNQGYDLEITESALDWIAQLGYAPQFGARPLKRVIQKRIMDELSKQILGGTIKEGLIRVDLKEGELTFESILEGHNNPIG
jgi:ATP-dependent Clp protease ATP-binding subunit ClpB